MAGRQQLLFEEIPRCGMHLPLVFARELHESWKRSWQARSEGAKWIDRRRRSSIADPGAGDPRRLGEERRSDADRPCPSRRLAAVEHASAADDAAAAPLRPFRARLDVLAYRSAGIRRRQCLPPVTRPRDRGTALYAAADGGDR